MSATPLRDIWEASASQPFQPSIGKDSQFTIGFALLLISLIFTGLFGLSMSCFPELLPSMILTRDTDNSLKNLPIYGIPASLAFG